MATLALCAALAAILGFAAHRASICTVRAVAELMTTRRGYMLASVAKSALWVAVVTVPIFVLSAQIPQSTSWAAPAGWQLTGMAVLGGFVFGLGAAVNGACIYSTMARLVDGEGGMAVAVVGLCVGVVAFLGLLDLDLVARPKVGQPLIGTVIGWTAVAALAALGIYEIVRLWRTRPPGQSLRQLVFAKQYRLSTAALLIGAAAGLIYALVGPYGYATTVQQGVEALFGRRAGPDTLRWTLLAAALAGMLFSSVQRGSFRIDWRPRRAWAFNFSGGILMGFGVALAPGGNDSLVLYAIPTLSPHAIPTYLALGLGVALGLLAMRYLFGVHIRAECRNDLYFNLPPANK